MATGSHEHESASAPHSFRDSIHDAEVAVEESIRDAERRVSLVANAVVDAEDKMHITRDDLVNQQRIAADLPISVRIIGVTLAFLAVIFTWEAVDHLVVHLFPGSQVQILAQCMLLVFAIILLWLSKKLTDCEWVDLGSLGFTLGSLFSAAATWGLVAAIIRIYFRQSARLGVWMMGSLIFLGASFIYMLLTKHNALLDIASCANSLGYFDLDDSEDASQTRLEAASCENYKGCS